MTVHSVDVEDDPREGPFQGAEPQVTIHSYCYTVLKRRWVVLAVALATWLVAAVVSFVETPMYKSTALIQVDGSRINLVQDVTIDDGRSGSADLYATQEKILRSRALARSVAEELELWKHPFFGVSADASDPERRTEILKTTVNKLLDAMQALHIRQTHLIEISFATPDPELSARLANTLTEQYIRFSIAEESGLARNTSSFIREQVEELRREIREKENLLREYSRNQEIVMAESTENNIVFQRLEELNRQLTQAEAERSNAEVYYRGLRRAAPLTIPEVRNSASVRGLLTTHDALAEQLAEASTRFKAGWPEVQRLRESLAEARRRLDARVEAEAAQIIAQARMAYHAARERERLLAESLEIQKAEARELTRVAAGYGQMRVELDNQREMLQSLVRRQSETSLSAELGERQPVKVRVVDGAEVAASPFSPNVLMNLLVGAVLGVVLGVGVAFLLETIDRSIGTPDDLRRHAQLPYLGMIPRFATAESRRPRLLSSGAAAKRLESGRGRARVSAPSQLARRPSSEPKTVSWNVLEERFRFLRGSLLLSTPGMVPKIVLVSSPEQSCGKTFVSSHLGRAFVQLGKRVLLVDSDLRNPNLHRVFGYRNRTGLTNVLTRQKALADGCVMRTQIPNLFLLMAGPKSPNPGELLGSKAMADTLKECARHFDFVILDSAPLLPVFDSHTLTRYCDATVMVVRSGTTTHQALRTSTELVERVQGRVTGVVLNDVDLQDYAHSYYHSSYSYDYGEFSNPGAASLA